MRFCRWFRIDWKAANYKPAAGATPNRISSRKNNRAAVAWNSCPGQFSDSDKYTDWNKLATFLRGQRLPESTSLNKLSLSLWLADINKISSLHKKSHQYQGRKYWWPTCGKTSTYYPCCLPSSTDAAHYIEHFSPCRHLLSLFTQTRQSAAIKLHKNTICQQYECLL